MPLGVLPFLFLVVPIAEIAVFIVVGNRIGLGWTLGLTLLTAVAGSFLLRIQGFAVLRRIRADVEAGRVPGRELVHGVMIVAAGILLLTPGFITDTLGLLLFLPPVRDTVWNFLRNRVVIVTPRATGRNAERPADYGDGPIVDLGAGDYSGEPDPRSPWRKPPDVL